MQVKFVFQDSHCPRPQGSRATHLYLKQEPRLFHNGSVCQSLQHCTAHRLQPTSTLAKTGAAPQRSHCSKPLATVPSAAKHNVRQAPRPLLQRKLPLGSQRPRIHPGDRTVHQGHLPQHEMRVARARLIHKETLQSQLRTGPQ